MKVVEACSKMAQREDSSGSTPTERPLILLDMRILTLDSMKGTMQQHLKKERAWKICS